MVSALQWGSVVFAVIAAILWLKSAMVKTPSSFPIHVIQPDSFSRPFGEPLGGTYVGHGHSPALNELGEALCRQSKWSAVAAVFAAISALCQALAIALDVAK
ncbi:MAG: hypothetical protein ACXV5H_09640 [Halobacteriota archaeon]